MTTGDTLFYLAAAIFALIIIVAILISFVQWIIGFRTEYRYIKNEINRTYGREKKYWIRQKRRLILSVIPFVRYYR